MAHYSARTSDSQSRDRLSMLPPEILIMICSHVSAADIVMIERCNRGLREILAEEGTKEVLAKRIMKPYCHRWHMQMDSLQFAGLPVDVAMRRFETVFGRPWEHHPIRGWVLYRAFVQACYFANQSKFASLRAVQASIVMLLWLSNTLECYRVWLFQDSFFDDLLWVAEEWRWNLRRSRNGSRLRQPAAEWIDDDDRWEALLETDRYVARTQSASDRFVKMARVGRDLFPEAARSLSERELAEMLLRIKADPLIDQKEHPPHRELHEALKSDTAVQWILSDRLQQHLHAQAGIPLVVGGSFVPLLRYPRLKTRRILDSWVKKTSRGNGSLDLVWLETGALIEHAELTWDCSKGNQ